jgi:hypothetical protein
MPSGLGAVWECTTDRANAIFSGKIKVNEDYTARYIKRLILDKSCGEIGRKKQAFSVFQLA